MTVLLYRLGLLSLLIDVSQAAYTLIPGGSYEGSTFFDGWNFYGAGDNLTNGNVIFANMATAFNTSNPLVEINSAQNAVFRVDNRSTVEVNFPRNSVRLDSKTKYGVGTLMVIDIVHMPFGCSVWPAFFTRGDDWPNNGEIDILEGWNKRTQNLMSLHTTTGCSIPQNVTQQGTLQNADCNQGNATVGCGVLASDTTTFGQGFNDAQGGVYATQFDVSGVFIWFFSRNNIPDSLKQNSTSGTIDDLTSWGMPTASFPASGSCNITQKFGPQTLSLVITLCGDAAGAVSEYPKTCADQAPNTPNPPPPGGGPDGSLCYPDNVVGPGSPRYDDAYFEVSHLRIYTASASAAAAAASNGTSTSSGSPGSPSSQTSAETSQTGSSSRALGLEAFPFVLSLLVIFLGILLGAVVC